MAKEILLAVSSPTGLNQVAYRESKIVSLSTHRQLFNGLPSVGNCFVGELNCELMVDSEQIPRNARMMPYIRDEESKTWIQKSVFYIYSRQVDEHTGNVNIIAYDPLYYGEEGFCQPGEQGKWPRTDQEVMEEIARRIKAPLHSDSIAQMKTIASKSGYSNGYPVPYPGITLTQVNADGSETATQTADTTRAALTMREVAGRIAGYYGGNWIIDNNGYLRLILLGDLPAETNFLVTHEGSPIVFGSGTKAVRILV